MAFNPGVSFFVPFDQLNPSEQSTCIFFTLEGKKCPWPCKKSDNSRAVVLHKIITASSCEAISLDILQEYVLCNCCRSGNARHRDRIEDIGLLIPLAQRWQDEIRRHVTKSNHTTSATALQSTATEVAFRSYPRYDLRSREVNISTDSTPSISPPLSEFRPHIAEPLPSDLVSRKMLDRLGSRDFETGSLYIFGRAASPGYVKIGWTANSVQCRLDHWSNCGYKPNLLFSVNCVPHAQRVETFTHHELIKE